MSKFTYIQMLLPEVFSCNSYRGYSSLVQKRRSNTSTILPTKKNLSNSPWTKLQYYRHHPTEVQTCLKWKTEPKTLHKRYNLKTSILKTLIDWIVRRWTFVPLPPFFRWHRNQCCQNMWNSTVISLYILLSFNCRL